MADFSIGTSIGDAFGLVKRRPLSVFIWGLLMLAPVFGSMALVFPMMAEMFAGMEAADWEHDAAPFADPTFARMMQFQMASLLGNVVQLVVMAVVYTAIFRAVLRPRERAFFSLRLGMDELRVAVVGLAIGVALYIVMLIAVLACVALGVGLGFQDAGLGVLVAVLLGIALFLAVCWLLARVSLMAPASVLYRDFAFVQGWRLARDKGWPLFGMMLLIFLIAIVIEAIGFILVALAFSGAFMTMSAAAIDGGNPFASMNDWIAAHWYWAVVGGLVFSLIYGVVLTLCAAPFASACRQLADDSTAPADDGPASSAV
ncbi:hypothetical protein [Brevundimonas sp.]|uniref:hypothetical protein n=1 Tax=Brevundimonas sp. TaxID=1871086 RepID=UPI002D41DD1A|nr:hypothetical protein [Brevundimonas sp.]HYC66599.1 hypothetical protein [Brevundimonas sp.]